MKTTQIRFLLIIVIIGFIMSVAPSPVMADPVWELQYCTQSGVIPQMLQASGGVFLRSWWSSFCYIFRRGELSGVYGG